MKKGQTAAVILLILVIAIIGFGAYRFLSSTKVPVATIIDGTTTIESGTECRYFNYGPDPKCTPGEKTAVTVEEICKSGYASSVRDVSEETKKQVYAMYGITSHKKGEYEIDHLISLELGGSNSISNLWPEPVSPVPGYKEKDKAENKLHSLVCSNKIPLASAQYMISHNWQSNTGLYQ